MKKRGKHNLETLWILFGIVIVGLIGFIAFLYYGTLYDEDIIDQNVTNESDNSTIILTCILTSAYWSDTYVSIGGSIDMIVEGESCEGELVTYEIYDTNDELVNSKSGVEINEGNAVARWLIGSTNPDEISIVITLLLPLLMSGFFILTKKGFTLHAYHIFAIAIMISLIIGVSISLLINNEIPYKVFNQKNSFISLSTHDSSPYYFTVTLESDSNEVEESGLLEVG